MCDKNTGDSLRGLKPEGFFKWFEAICRIPHVMRYEEKLSLFLQNFAQKRGLTCLRDEMGNILTESVSTNQGMEREEISTYDAYGNRITRECTYKEQPKVTYTSKWQLYYNPVLAAQLTQDETQPEQLLD